MKHIMLFVVMLLAVSAHADTINHVAINANISNIQQFAGSFDWDVDAQTPINNTFLATGPINSAFNFFTTIWTNFASWSDGLGRTFQIDIRPYRAAGNLTTFDDIGIYNATHGQGALEYYGHIDGLPYSEFGAWNGLTGNVVISTPEPTTLAMLLVALLCMMFALKPIVRH